MNKLKSAAEILMNSNKRSNIIKLISILIFATIRIFVEIQITIPNVNLITKLEPNWMMAIPSALTNDGNILGRDMIFTYGPLYQLIAALGVKLHAADIAIYSFHLIELAQSITATLIISLIILLIPFLNWPDAIIILLLANIDIRFLLLFATATFLSKGLTSNTQKSQILWGSIAGFGAFLGQIYTFDIGIYALALILFAGVLFSILAYLSKYTSILDETKYLSIRQYGAITFIAFLIFTICNLLLSLIFLLSSESYNDIFQYQKLSFEIARGYINTNGLTMELSHQISISFLILIVVVLWAFTVGNYKRFLKYEAPYLIILLTVATIFLKHSFHRSDFIHFWMSLSAVCFYWLIAWRLLFPSRQTPVYKRAIWYATVVVLFAFTIVQSYGLVFLNIYTKNDIDDGVEIFSFEPDKDKTQDIFYSLPAKYRTEDQLVILGIENYVAPLYGMEMIAPTIQIYAINTSELENYFVQKIQENDFPPILYSYALSWDFLGYLQNGAQFPELYEFIYRYYHLASLDYLDQEYQIAILEPREKHLPPIEWEAVRFQTAKEEDGITKLNLEKPQQCSLYKIKLSMDYPVFSTLLGTPGEVEMRFINNENIVSPDIKLISALERGKPFHIYISTLPNDQLWQLFYKQEDSIEIPIVDQVLFQPWKGEYRDPLYVSPSYDVYTIECANQGTS